MNLTVEKQKQTEQNQEKYKIITDSFTYSQYHIYICHDIQDAYHYIEIFNLLRDAKKEDAFHFYINNNGGNFWTLVQFVNNILASPAYTVGHLEGIAASAASMLFLACKEYDIKPYSSLMIHNYSSAISGKGGDLNEYVQFSESFIQNFYKNIYAGFLSKNELDQVFAGKDFWFNSAEIYKRLKNRHKTYLKDIAKNQTININKNKKKKD